MFEQEYGVIVVIAVVGGQRFELATSEGDLTQVLKEYSASECKQSSAGSSFCVCVVIASDELSEGLLDKIPHILKGSVIEIAEEIGE